MPFQYQAYGPNQSPSRRLKSVVNLQARPPSSKWHSDLQGPLIQGAVLALDPVPGSSLQIRVEGTSKDGAIFLQTLRRRVLGTREDLQIQGQLWGPHIQDSPVLISRH